MKRLIFSFLLLAPGAFAQDAAQIADYTHGRYEQAVAVKGAEPTAHLLAFKARAVLAAGMCEDFEPSTALLETAEDFAREALKLDSAHVEAKLQLAIALSLKARPLSNREAMKTGYGDEAKALVETALELDPDNAYANGFMAVWHIEVVRRGGAIGSRLMGASVTQARNYYQRATASESGDAGIHWQYARALAALNPRKYREDILSALAAAANSPVDSHVETVMANRALKLQQLLRSAKYRDIKAWAQQVL